MRGAKDRILASGIVLVLVGAVAFAYVNRPYVTTDGFDPYDHKILATNYPGGTYIPNDQTPLYYRLCLEGRWWRYYPDGYRWETGVLCWK